MPIRLRRLAYCLPAVLWMVAIFLVAGDRDSCDRPSRTIGPSVQWMFPLMPEDEVDRAVFMDVVIDTEAATLGLGLPWEASRMQGKW